LLPPPKPRRRRGYPSSPARGSPRRVRQGPNPSPDRGSRSNSASPADGLASGCTLSGWSVIRSSTFTTRILRPGTCRRSRSTAARASSVGTSSAQAMTTWGSSPSGPVQAHCQIPSPLKQCLWAWSAARHCGAGCLPATIDCRRPRRNREAARSRARRLRGSIRASRARRGWGLLPGRRTAGTSRCMLSSFRLMSRRKFAGRRAVSGVFPFTGLTAATLAAVAHEDEQELEHVDEVEIEAERAHDHDLALHV
jgi:hypothetical protein